MDHERLAGLLAGSRSGAGVLVDQARGAVPADAPDRDDALAVCVVRAFLSTGWELGAGLAADVDTPLAAVPADAGLPAAVRASSPLQRAVLVLHRAAGLPPDEIARVVGSTPEGIARYLRHVLESLGLGAGGYPIEQLDAAVAGLAPRGAPEAAPASTGRGPGRPRRRRLGLGLLAAAIVAGALAAAVSGGGGGGGGGDSTGSAPGVPSPVSQPTLPGTRVLQQLHGTGPATLHLGFYRASAGFELALGLACRGAGPVGVATLTLASCAGPVVAQLPADGPPELRVRAPARTRWRLAVVRQPLTQTNAALARPPDPSLSGAPVTGSVGAAHGTGSATVPLTGSGTGARLRVSLVCTGSGVSLSSADGAADGSYTRTCFAGWSYEFDLTGCTLPGSLTVSAGRDTAWRLTVRRV